MPTAYNKIEAQRWFEYSDDLVPGTLTCVREDETQKECSSYPEASAFFNGVEYIPED